jgi:hypothetical protein
MTIGPENHSNGAATAQDRFSGGVSAFRQSRREALAAESGDAELVTRTSQVLSPQSHARTIEPTSALDRAGNLPSLDLHGLSEPVFQQNLPEPVFHSNGWMEAGAIAESMADHPLLRGLLLELPARGTMPAADWLDRWFEAARSILELLYVQESKRNSA